MYGHDVQAGNMYAHSKADYIRRDTFNDIFACRGNHQQLDDPGQPHHTPSTRSFPLNQTLRKDRLRG